MPEHSVARQSEIDSIVAEWTRIANEETMLLGLPRLVQVWATRD